MAYSTNQNQLVKHGSTLLGVAEVKWSQPLRSIALWNRVNLLAADYGERHLPGRYLRVRFEDLCAEPVSTILRIFDFFCLRGDAEQIARTEVIRPDSAGRWRTQDRATLMGLHRVGRTALERFGYCYNSYHAGGHSQPDRAG